MPMDELNQPYLIRDTIGGFDTLYWPDYGSSSEFEAGIA